MMKLSKFDGYDCYEISCGDVTAEIISLGASVKSLRYKGRETLLSYKSAAEYMAGSAYICAAIGRYGNRIGGARFSLGGVEYSLSPNENKNQLHGGPMSWDKRVWEAEVLSENSLRMSIFSPDGDNGFPGAMTASFTYTVTENALRIDFGGVSEADTVYAPTSHLYFNLDGTDDIRETELMINASGVLEIDSELIPTGSILPAEGYFDFSSPRKIADDYDHAFILNSAHACTLSGGGIKMELHTDMPALQIYTSQGLGEPFGNYKGVAIEPEFYPDSPNKPHFPSTLLKKGEDFHRYAEYRFFET